MKLSKLIKELQLIQNALTTDVDVIIQNECSATGFYSINKNLKIDNHTKNLIGKKQKKVSGNHIILKTKGSTQ